MKKIRLWKNRNELSDEYTIVDDEDYDKVMEHLKKYKKDGYRRDSVRKWYLWKSPTGNIKYAMSGNRRSSVHRIVMGNPKGMDIDHINHNGLDNRKENLRICTHSQNCANKKARRDSGTGVKGVYKVKRENCKKPFCAYISDPKTKFPKKRHIRLGYYKTIEEAALAYNKKAIEMYGEFAVLNEIKGKDNGG